MSKTMKHCLTYISAVGLGDDGVVDCQVRPTIVGFHDGNEDRIRERLLEGARESWPHENGWRLHRVGAFQELKRKAQLKMAGSEP